MTKFKNSVYQVEIGASRVESVDIQAYKIHYLPETPIADWFRMQWDATKFALSVTFALLPVLILISFLFAYYAR